MFRPRHAWLLRGTAVVVMGVVAGGLELYAGPVTLGAPDDLDQVVRDFIADAKSSLLVAVQELDSRTIAEALPAAHARKVAVQVVLESSYLAEPKPPADPWAAAGQNEANPTIHAALLRAGIRVIVDLNPAIFHQKFVVRDAHTDHAAALRRHCV